MKRVAVYCGSRFGGDPLYPAVARDVGRTLAERGLGVVYGGGRLGLMGAVADAALDAGGEVFGVIPEVLVEAEAAHPGLTQLHVVPGMHERKARMTELADAFVTLPGGIGTMDELFEALSWGLLGYHAKPVGLLDVGGYYRDLVSFMDGMTAAGFLRPEHRENLVVADEIGTLLDKLDAHVMPPTVVDMVRGRL